MLGCSFVSLYFANILFLNVTGKASWKIIETQDKEPQAGAEAQGGKDSFVRTSQGQGRLIFLDYNDEKKLDFGDVPDQWIVRMETFKKKCQKRSDSYKYPVYCRNMKTIHW